MLGYQQITPPDIGMVKAAQYFKTAILIYLAQVTRGDKGATVEVGQVDDIESAGLSGLSSRVRGSLGSRTRTFIQGGVRNRPSPDE